MKRFVIAFLFSFCVAVQAGSLITATITVTNTPSDGDTIVVNGATRTWKTSVATAATQISVGTGIGGNATNMFDQFAAHKFTALNNVSMPATNQVSLRGLPDTTIAITITGTWGSYALSTNSTASGSTVIVPASSYATQSTATNIQSLLALDLGLSTNKLANGTKLLEGVVQTNGTQTINGDKTFTGASTLTNANQIFGGGRLIGVSLYGVTNASVTNFYLYGPAFVSNTAPHILWRDTDAGVDSGVVDMNLYDGNFQLNVYNDALSSFSTGLEIDRSGATVTGVTFPNGETRIGNGGASDRLRVFGGTRFDRHDITSLTSSNNAAIALDNRTFCRFPSGPTNAFNLNGIAGGGNGQFHILYNATPYQMTIVNDSGVDPTPGNRIYTLVGSNIVCTAAMIAYDSSEQRWIVVGTPNITAVSGGSSTTINSADGAIPVRGSSTTFTNSPLHVASSGALVGTNAVADGTTPWTWDTSVAHTSGTLSLWKNNGTTEGKLWYDGTLSANNFGTGTGGWLADPDGGSTFKFAAYSNGGISASQVQVNNNNSTTILQLDPEHVSSLKDLFIYSAATNKVEVGNGVTKSAQFDASSTSSETRLLLWDVSASALVRVTRGAADSGGAGFRVLRIPN